MEIKGTDISKIQMEIVAKVDSGEGSLSEVLRDTTLPDLTAKQASEVVSRLVEFFINRKR